MKRARYRKLAAVVAAVVLATVALVASWIVWGAWPGSRAVEVPWVPDAIVVLGGGNDERPREALRLAALYPHASIIVTGDGGSIHQALLRDGLPLHRLVHERSASTTVENAVLTEPKLEQLAARRVVLVTNWFHAPRSIAIFKRYQPEREFAASFEPRPEQLDVWHAHVSRRERLAVLHHVVRYGIWSF